MSTDPEMIVIDLTDGSHFSAMIHVESGKLHVALPWLGTFVIQPESAHQVCERILELLLGENWRAESRG